MDSAAAEKKSNVLAALGAPTPQPKPFESYEAWKATCLKESWSSYGNRSSAWFERQWQRAQKAIAHPKAGAFMQATTNIGRKTWWAFNPKETVDKFEKWLHDRGLSLESESLVSPKVEEPNEPVPKAAESEETKSDACVSGAASVAPTQMTQADASMEAIVETNKDTSMDAEAEASVHLLK